MLYQKVINKKTFWKNKDKMPNKKKFCPHHRTFCLAHRTKYSNNNI